jgi:hypothetical protein
MPNEDTNLNEQLAALRREIEALRRENERVRAERKEAFDLVLEKVQAEAPTEYEMVAQLATVVPFSVVMKEVDRILNGHSK